MRQASEHVWRWSAPRGREPIALVPDWCNTGIGLRVVAALNGLAMSLAAVVSSDLASWASTCLRFALTLEPVLLASLFFGCLSRPWVHRWPTRVQVAFAILIPALLTVLIENGLSVLLQSGVAGMARDALLAALAAAATLYWAQLRNQSHLPALAEARLAALQARIRPHFLFNSLNAVLGLIRSEPRRAESMLEDLADLFRVLMRDHHERVALSEELALCRKYLDIERLRLGTRLEIESHIDARAEDAQVPLLLLQPLLENAVLHGIEPSAVPGRIELRIERQGHLVEILISNPWHGETVRNGHKIGLANVRQRLELLHDLEATLETAVRHNRFEVRMSLPFVRSPGTVQR